MLLIRDEYLFDNIYFNLYLLDEKFIIKIIPNIIPALSALNERTIQINFDNINNTFSEIYNQLNSFRIHSLNYHHAKNILNIIIKIKKMKF
jgi:hypothetical protein